MSAAEYALEDDKKENCKKIKNNTEEQNKVKNKNSSDLEGNIEESSEKKFKEQQGYFKGNKMDISNFTTVIQKTKYIFSKYQGFIAKIFSVFQFSLKTRF